MADMTLAQAIATVRDQFAVEDCTCPMCTVIRAAERTAEAERAVVLLAAKLSEVRGSGPCDDDDCNFWPCPLCANQNGADDCTNDVDGCCWKAWAHRAAATEQQALAEATNQGDADRDAAVVQP